MKWLNHKNVLLLFALLGSWAILAQQPNTLSNERKALEKQRKELLNKIQETKKVLAETRKKTDKSLSDLKVISTQIKNRQQVINTVINEIGVIEKQIVAQQDVINTLRTDLERLKQEYGKSVLGAYKQRNVYDKIMFIFAAKSFNQAIKRIQYLNQLGDYRRHQADLILHTQQQITEELNELVASKREKENLIQLKEQERAELEVDKKEESSVLQKLQDREKELRRILAENERSARKLNDAIAELIKKEIAEARKKAEEEARKKAAETASKGTKAKPSTPAKTSAAEMYLTPEAIKLSNDFESNKNSLPWPVEKGTITTRFGQHPHPTLKGVVVNNNGLDIKTEPDAGVRSVFKGTVKSIFSIPGMGKVVLINHGKYYTAYAKLATVQVKEGQSIDTKQTIGTILTNDENETEVHFEIWKSQDKQDPEVWLKK
ncbi:MAG: peptidoglycan DD-metalloendopeptidase family protein [Bacteroidia bacterium]|nr:peptidoglycan DD-metalloendopeptidase family protein [Bacteroidia bacterium]